MRKLLLTFGLMAVAVPAGTLSAQGGHRSREVRQETRECRRELRDADNRREFNRERRECQRELANARRSGRYQDWDKRWRHR